MNHDYEFRVASSGKTVRYQTLVDTLDIREMKDSRGVKFGRGITPQALELKDTLTKILELKEGDITVWFQGNQVF